MNKLRDVGAVEFLFETGIQFKGRSANLGSTGIHFYEIHRGITKQGLQKLKGPAAKLFSTWNSGIEDCVKGYQWYKDQKIIEMYTAQFNFESLQDWYTNKYSTYPIKQIGYHRPYYTKYPIEYHPYAMY